MSQPRMERSMWGISLGNQIRNEEVRTRTGVVDVIIQITIHKNGDGRPFGQKE